MRKLGIALLVIVVLLVAAALIVPHVIDVNSYHAQIQSQLEKKLGRQVSLGPMSLSLFPPSFQVNNAVIGEDKNFNTTRAFATADRLAVSIKLLPLLRKEVDVRSLELVHPRIELVRNAQGAWNFATMGQQGKPAPAEKAAANQAAPAQAPNTQPAPQENKTNQQPAKEFELANLRRQRAGITDITVKHLDRHGAALGGTQQPVDDLPLARFAVSAIAILCQWATAALQIAGGQIVEHQAAALEMTPGEGALDLGLRRQQEIEREVEFVLVDLAEFEDGSQRMRRRRRAELARGGQFGGRLDHAGQRSSPVPASRAGLAGAAAAGQDRACAPCLAPRRYDRVATSARSQSDPREPPRARLSEPGTALGSWPRASATGWPAYGS